MLVYPVLAETELIPECIGFIWRQSVVRCSSGWRARWVGGQVLGKRLESGRQSRWRWTNSTSHKSPNSWLPGWAVSEAILPALLFALALGDWSAESNRRAMTLSAGWHTTLFLSPRSKKKWSSGSPQWLQGHSWLSMLIPRHDMLQNVYPACLLEIEIFVALHSIRRRRIWSRLDEMVCIVSNQGFLLQM